MKKVKVLGYSAISVFLFDIWKWFFQGQDYGEGLLFFSGSNCSNKTRYHGGCKKGWSSMNWMLQRGCTVWDAGS
jgi:hypothetical protein